VDAVVHVSIQAVHCHQGERERLMSVAEEWLRENNSICDHSGGFIKQRSWTCTHSFNPQYVLTGLGKLREVLLGERRRMD